MRKIYFLYPGMNLNVGGHLAQLKLFEITKLICPSEAVTYVTQEDGILFLDAVLEQDSGRDSIFIIHWGPHIVDLIRRLAGKNIVYVSYTTGYGFRLPADVPIIAGSKHTQAYWGRYSPNSLLYYLPCTISDNFRNLHKKRDMDILVQKRKSSRYLLEELIPQLQTHASVMVLDSWVEDLAEVLNRSKIYLYESSEYWGQLGVSEGFGLPPLEALACGCTVFSSVNDALSDYLDPGFNCHKLRVYSTEYDVNQILKAVKEWRDIKPWTDPAQEYRHEKIKQRLEVIISGLNEFFDHKELYPCTIEDTGVIPNEARIQSLQARIQQMETSKGWKLLEQFRMLYAKLLRILKSPS
jgi:hypothetical protein